MTPPRVLVVYATTHGHTRRIAQRIADVLGGRGLEVRLEELDKRGTGVTPADHDAVIVGASLHGERHQPQIVAWARQHQTSLSLRPSALFSVSLTAAEDGDGLAGTQQASGAATGGTRP